MNRNSFDKVSKKAIIIGAGIAGIATSIRLAAKGYKVEVFEKTTAPGGKLSEFTLGVFRFDYGPSLFTLPYLVDELLQLSNVEHDFEYRRLEKACTYYYPDGVVLEAWTDLEKFAAEIECKLKTNGDQIRSYLRHLNEIYESAASIFLKQSLHKRSTYLQKKTLTAFLRAHKMHLFKSMDKVNQGFLSHPKLVQLFNRFATYNGSNPYKAPGILNTIACLEHIHGAFFPKGGMYSITKCLFNTACKMGVQFHFNQSVSKIKIKDKTACGVELNRDFIKADLVVSNIDVYHTYHNLLPDVSKPKFLIQEKSSSAIVFYWGIHKKTKLGLHNILFSKNYKTEFDHLFIRKNLGPDPTVYINISSKINNIDAPANGENWFVMINAPSINPTYKVNLNYAKEIVLTKITNALSINLENEIVEERILSPMQIASDTGSHLGALYGNSSNNRLSAFLRHPNFSRKIKNLYFVGGSVHPGGGIPLCLLSAKITSELIPAV